MVGDDAMARALRAVDRRAGEIGDRAGQRAKQIDVVIGGHALHQRGDALEPHAGVDRGARQRRALPRRHLLILHEDEVPELQESVAVLVRAAGRTAFERLALIVEDLRAGAAGASVAHAPEIVGAGDADDAAVVEAGDLFPQIIGLVVVVIDGDEQPIDVEPEFARDEVPGELDRAFLEIVAEGEIAQHFKEGVMARGIADIVEVVVLAAGAHAFLRRGGARIGALLDAGEDVLELHHAGVGEHQRRIIVRHERRGGDFLVPIVREIVEEGGSDLVDATHAVTARECVSVAEAAFAPMRETRLKQ